MTPERIKELKDYVRREFPGGNLIGDLLNERDRLLRGEFTEAEAAALIKAVVERQGLTRAQVETACWEWQERTFGPRKTDGTTSLVGAGGFDGTYPTDQSVVPGGNTKIVPGTAGDP